MEDEDVINFILRPYFPAFCVEWLKFSESAEDAGRRSCFLTRIFFPQTMVVRNGRCQINIPTLKMPSCREFD
jgi:hypothetical protein